jgi:hypothetical protein
MESSASTVVLQVLKGPGHSTTALLSHCTNALSLSKEKHTGNQTLKTADTQQSKAKVSKGHNNAGTQMLHS